MTPNPTPDEKEEAKEFLKLFATSTFCMPNTVGHIATILTALEAAERERDGMRELYTILVQNDIALEDRATRAEAEVARLHQTYCPKGEWL